MATESHEKCLPIKYESDEEMLISKAIHSSLPHVDSRTPFRQDNMWLYNYQPRSNNALRMGWPCACEIEARIK